MALSELPLSRTTLDRNALARSGDNFMPSIWEDASTLVLPVRNGQVPMRDGKLVTVAPSALDTWNVSHGRPQDFSVYLGRDTVTGSHYVSAELAGPLPSDNPPMGADIADAAIQADLVPPGTSWVALRSVATELDASDAGIAVTSIAMFNWHRTMNFCHHCAAPTVAGNCGWVRVCTREKRELFPRTDSAVIMSVIDSQGRILLAQNSAAPDPQRVSVLAGFVEPGEPLEAAVRREVLEESGIVVTDVNYLGSQPWPFPMSLMVGFEARFDGDGSRAALTLQQDEIAWAEWFSREEIVRAIAEDKIWLPSKSSIARAIINHWYGDDSLESPVDH